MRHVSHLLLIAGIAFWLRKLEKNILPVGRHRITIVDGFYLRNDLGDEVEL